MSIVSQEIKFEARNVVADRALNVEVEEFVTTKLEMVVVPKYELPVTVRAEVEALLNVWRAVNVFEVYVLGIVVEEPMNELTKVSE